MWPNYLTCPRPTMWPNYFTVALPNLLVIRLMVSVYSSSFDGEFSSSLVQVARDGFLLMPMASILLSSSKISQLTNVHNKKLQAFLSLPVYFSFFNFKMINSGLIIKYLDMIKQILVN